MARTAERRQAERRRPERRAPGKEPEKSKNFLTKKVGPLPMWVWLAGVGIVIYYYESTKKASATTPTTTPATTGAGFPTSYPGSGRGFPFGAGGGGGTGTGTGTATGDGSAVPPTLFTGPPSTVFVPYYLSGSVSPGNAGGNGAGASSPGNTMTSAFNQLLGTAMQLDLSPHGVTPQEQSLVSAGTANLKAGAPVSPAQSAAMQTFSNVQSHPIATGKSSIPVTPSTSASQLVNYLNAPTPAINYGALPSLAGSKPVTAVANPSTTAPKPSPVKTPANAQVIANVGGHAVASNPASLAKALGR